MRYVKNDTSLRKMYGLTNDRIQVFSAFYDELEVYQEKYLDLYPSFLAGEWMLAISFEIEGTYDRRVSFSKLVKKNTQIEGETLVQAFSDGKWKITRSGIIYIPSDSIPSVLRYFGKNMMQKSFLFTVEEECLKEFWTVYLQNKENINSIANYICSVEGKMLHIVYGYDGLSFNLLSGEEASYDKKMDSS